jgi:GGDEF domain-containing protein
LARAVAALAASHEKPSASISGGAAEYPTDGATATKLLGVADRALYVAKSARPVG